MESSSHTQYWLVRIVLLLRSLRLLGGEKWINKRNNKGMHWEQRLPFSVDIWFGRVQLIESREKERLKELLRERLIECGWRDELKAQCSIFMCKVLYSGCIYLQVPLALQCIV